MPQRRNSISLQELKEIIAKAESHYYDLVIEQMDDLTIDEMLKLHKREYDEIMDRIEKMNNDEAS